MQPERALQPLAAALADFERLAAQRADLSVEVANTQGWLAQAYESLGDLHRALALEQAKLQRLLGLVQGRDDLPLLRALMEAWRRIGRLQLALGQTEAAVVALVSATNAGDRLLAADSANLLWVQDACWTRIALGTARLAKADVPGARTDARAGRDCAARLAAGDANSLGRYIGVPGALALLEQSLPKASAIEVERNLAAVVARSAAQEARGASVVDYAELVAANELALGDFRSAAADLPAAREFWVAAQRRSQRAAATGNWSALTLLARAQLRLGAVAEARALAQRIEASPYRHPNYRLLTAELAAADGRPLWAAR